MSDSAYKSYFIDTYRERVRKELEHKASQQHDVAYDRAQFHVQVTPRARYDGSDNLNRIESLVCDLWRVFTTFPSYVPESDKVALLAGQLDDRALEWYYLEDRHTSNWLDICEALVERFVPAYPALFWDDLQALSQYSNTTGKERDVADVIDELERLCSRIGPSLTDKEMHSYLQGALATRFRSHLVCDETSSYAELKGACMRVRASLAEDDEREKRAAAPSQARRTTARR